MSNQPAPPNHAATHHQPPLTPDPSTLTSPGCYVALTLSPLDIPSLMNRVRSPAAGAIVLFAGTTRNTFATLPVSHLSYTSYPPLALRSMLAICQDVLTRHSLQGVAMAHRLGDVPIGEESIVICVSAAHRGAAWRAGEEALEMAKERVEVWKREEFVGREGGGVWRANKDGTGAGTGAGTGTGVGDAGTGVGDGKGAEAGSGTGEGEQEASKEI